jgi:heme-degrading monooxygenase HmoA
VYSRVTQLDIDTGRIGVGEAIEHFRRAALPALRAQDGYEGVCVLAAPEGYVLVISLWSSAEAADAGREAVLYLEALAPYVSLARAPGARERYEVAFADAPALVIG